MVAGQKGRPGRSRIYSIHRASRKEAVQIDNVLKALRPASGMAHDRSLSFQRTDKPSSVAPILQREGSGL